MCRDGAETYGELEMKWHRGIMISGHNQPQNTNLLYYLTIQQSTSSFHSEALELKRNSTNIKGKHECLGGTICLCILNQGLDPILNTS